MRKLYTLTGLLAILAFGLQCANIYLANTLDAKSMYLSQLQEEVSNVQQENTILKSEVLDYTSFDSIASRAAALGFSSEKDFVSLYSPSVVALGK